MIYFLEDDDSIRELVIYTLESTGIPALGFAAPAEFWGKIGQTTPDLILLDLMLPEESGISVLKKLKASMRLRDIPVIIITAKGSEFDRVTGLDAGADDYILKPFGMMELLARIRAVLRRAAAQKSPAAGPISIDSKRHSVSVRGRPVELTLKEFELLLALSERPGVVFTRDMLLSEVWGYEYTGESRTVDVHIRTLRGKLGEDGGLIETVRGIGYRFKGE